MTAGQRPRRDRRIGKPTGSFGLNYRNPDPDVVAAVKLIVVMIVRRTWAGR